ncbi:hypothetical protein HHUSO_G3663, partial [Huso huso]
TKCNQTVHELKCLYLNARSIRNTFLELEAIVNVDNYDITEITESWLTPNDGDEFNMEGYSLVRKDRHNKRGPGVTIYIKNNLEWEILESNGNNNESIWIKLNEIKSKGLIVGVCCRPPSSDESLNENLYASIKKISKEGDTLIMGDFNFPNINWDHMTSDNSSDMGMIELVQDCFLSQTVNAPTRYNSCLDLVLTNNEARIHTSQVIESLGISDHNMIKFVGNKSRAVYKSKTRVYNFRRADYKGMQQELLNIDWDRILIDNEAEKNWIKFRDTMLEMQDTFIPKMRKGKLKKNKPQWVNRFIKMGIKNKIK